MTENVLPDYSQYWVCYRFPDGRLLNAPSFEEEKFEQKYGLQASNAIFWYNHFSGNPPSGESAWRIFRNSVETLQEILKEDPQLVRAARHNAPIEDI